MTAFLPEPLLLTSTVTAPGALVIALHGDLDYETAPRLLTEATARLDGQDGLCDLHLDCAELGVCDSVGLSALLMIHRRSRRAGVRLRLVNRPATLERLLDITGTLEHLTGASAPGGEAEGEPAPGGPVSHSSTESS